MRYWVLIAENVKITVFWNVSPCSLVLMYLTTWCHIAEDSSELDVDFAFALQNGSGLFPTRLRWRNKENWMKGFKIINIVTKMSQLGRGI
jgi:hypothetical protein